MPYKGREHTVHFWLGLESTQDEKGTAVLCATDISTLYHASHKRETQGVESELFMSYFKNGIRYLEGGVASGFKNVEINAVGDRRMYHVKGKRNVRLFPVDVSHASMNQGDCFILDTGRDIYVYQGPKAKPQEKLKATAAANQICAQDHKGRCTVYICGNDGFILFHFHHFICDFSGWFF